MVVVRTARGTRRGRLCTSKGRVRRDSVGRVRVGPVGESLVPIEGGDVGGGGVKRKPQTTQVGDPRHAFHDQNRYGGPQPVIDYNEEKKKTSRMPKTWRRPTFRGLEGEPLPGEMQQTLTRSTTRIGIGIHSGSPAAVCLRPAHAGEGRYFVRVPSGTLDVDAFPQVPWATPAEKESEANLLAQFAANHGDGGGPGSLGVDATQIIQDFMASPDYKEKARQGDKSLDEWIVGDVGYDFEEKAEQDRDAFHGNKGNDDPRNRGPAPAPEEPSDGLPGETRIPATLASVRRGEEDALYTVLGEGDESVRNVEHLLSALEGMGVDNCRIEIEGGLEVPIVDGSPLPWSEAVLEVGVTNAKTREGSEVTKMARKPSQPVTVCDGEAFIAFMPGPTLHFSVGIDFLERSHAIGKNYFTWCPARDRYYREVVAPARRFCTLKEVYHMQKAGLLKGGSMENAIVADGKYWCNGFNRFAENEPTRHTLSNLIGNLSLLSEGGNTGMPVGHIVAFKADQALQLKFAQAFAEASGNNESWEPASAINPAWGSSYGDSYELDLEAYARAKSWDNDEFEYRTGINVEDNFETWQEEAQYTKEYFEKMGGAGDESDGNESRGDENRVDKVTID